MKMQIFKSGRGSLRAIAAGLAGLVMSASAASAATIWDEAINGELSAAGAVPTVLSLALGSNLVSGSTINSPLDRDMFQVTVESGQRIDAIVLSAYTTADDQAFFAVDSGPQVSSTSDASQLLGVALIGAAAGAQVGDDLLDDLGSPSFGSPGFSGPLEAGVYSFWYQETAGATSYTFDIQVSEVPVPPSLALFALAIAGLRATTRRSVRAA